MGLSKQGHGLGHWSLGFLKGGVWDILQGGLHDSYPLLFTPFEPGWEL